MLLVDANVLLYAVNTGSHHHRESRRWLEGALNAGESVGLAWIVLLAFLRLSTRANLFARPLTASEALGVVDAWLQQPGAILVDPGPRHLRVLSEVLRESGAAGNLVSDAHLAALALENDADLISYDADFARFDGLRWGRPGG